MVKYCWGEFIKITHNTYGGGKKTNVNGLLFEKETSLNESLLNAGYNIEENKVYNKNNELIGLSIKQHSFYHFLEENNINYIDYNSKKWLPDEAFINFENNTLYIVEKKYQENSGSVDEKLPNCHFKRKEYLKLVRPLGLKVNYIYVFNDWYKQHQYKDILEYIQDMGCEYYFNEIPFESIGLKKEH